MSISIRSKKFVDFHVNTIFDLMTTIIKNSEDEKTLIKEEFENSKKEYFQFATLSFSLVPFLLLLPMVLTLILTYGTNFAWFAFPMFFATGFYTSMAYYVDVKLKNIENKKEPNIGSPIIPNKIFKISLILGSICGLFFMFIVTVGYYASNRV